MFSYKLTIKNRKSRKAKLEKFYDALESSDLTKAEKTHMRKQISSTVRNFYALAKKFNCLPMTIKRTYENAKISIRIKLMHAGTLDALGEQLIYEILYAGSIDGHFPESCRRRPVSCDRIDKYSQTENIDSIYNVYALT